MQKQIVALHDISCFGKCSLTVVLPLISAAGISCSVIPTAILSTHTGGFQNIVRRDCTEDILPIARHWQQYQLVFDAFYTGYLGSRQQVEIVSQALLELAAPQSLILVDPVMGDNGSLYASFDKDFPDIMRRLCSQASIICPNITEACLLTHTPYSPGPYNEQYLTELLEKLAGIGPKQIVLTGVYFDASSLGVAVYQGHSAEYILAPKINGHYHGTGDIFASILLGGILNNLPLLESARLAVDFTRDCVEGTARAKTDPKYGVHFETGISGLKQRMNAIAEGLL